MRSMAIRHSGSCVQALSRLASGRGVIFWLLLVSILNGDASWGCSLSFEPLKRPSQQELVLVGSVAAVASHRDIAALKLDDVQPVWPRSISGPIEIDVFELMVTCDTPPISSSGLEAKFPIGARVAVVAEARNRESPSDTAFIVILGGNSSIDPASDPSQRFLLRSKLATLEAGLPQDEAVDVVRSLIPDQTGEVDLGGVIQRYVIDKRKRRSLHAECVKYWSKWDGQVRCEGAG
jgi:hypothetical protein